MDWILHKSDAAHRSLQHAKCKKMKTGNAFCIHVYTLHDYPVAKNALTADTDVSYERILLHGQCDG